MNPDKPGAQRLPPADFMIGIVLAVFATAVFWPGLSGSFIYDDLVDIRNVDAVFSPGGWTDLFTTASAQLYRPVKYVSYYVDNLLFGWNARGWHGQSVLWHAVNCVLLMQLAKRLGASRTAAAIGAGWFAIHPIHAEAVVWISSRASLQSTTGVLMMLIGYDRWRAERSNQNLAILLAGGFIGFFSKEDALMIFPILLAYEWYLRRMGFSELAREKYVHLALGPLAALGALYVLLRQSILAGISQGTHEGGFSGWLSSEPVILATYLRQLIWPDPMCIDQPVNYSAGFGGSFWMAAGLLATLGALLAVRRPSWGRWQFAVTFFFISLIPVMGLIPINQARADRFLYLPSVAAAVALGWLVDAAGQRFQVRTALLLALAALGSFYGWRTWNYSKTFLNEGALWEQVMAVNPKSYRAWANVAALNNNAGRFDQALPQIDRALNIRPEYPEGWVIKAYALHRQKQFKEADVLYRKALQSVPDEPRWLFLLADLEQEQGRLDEAEKLYDRIFTVRPGYVEARISAGTLAIEMKNFNKARAHWQEALKHEPRNADAQHNLRLLERNSR